jgi:hypothetical protein
MEIIRIHKLPSQPSRKQFPDHRLPGSLHSHDEHNHTIPKNQGAVPGLILLKTEI